ncbi:MAG: DM13 domain-containing protein [Bacteroidia bacterium]
MKKIIIATLVLSTVLVACKKKTTEGVIPATPTALAAGDVVVAKANFETNVHTTTGEANLVTNNGVKKLKFVNFKTDSGPDLRVYLSKAKDAKDFVDLGKLKATSGNIEYDVASTINISEYKYVIIWCEDYSVLFGNAHLQ